MLILACAVGCSVGPGQYLGYLRISGLGILLLMECLALTILHDTEALLGDDRWWAYLLGEVHILPSLALTIAVSMVVFGGESLRRGFNQMIPFCQANHSGWRLALGVHLLLLAIFHLLSSRILNPETNTGWMGDLGFTGWLLCGALWMGAWGLAVWPWAAWKQFVREFSILVLAALGMGLFAFGSARLTELLWAPMADVTLSLVHSILALILSDILCDPAERIIGTAGFLVQIAPSCSGYEGLGLVGAVVAIYLWFRRAELRFPHALILLPISLAAVWLANLARIVLLILIGVGGWPEVARGGFHSQAGWLSFNAVALGIVLLSQYVSWLHRHQALPQERRSYNPTVVYLLPLMVVVGTSMITAALASGGMDLWYPVRVFVGLAVIIWLSHDLKTICCATTWRMDFFLGVLAVGTGIFAIWIGLEYLLLGSPTGQAAPEPLQNWTTTQRWLWLGVRMFGGIVIVPIAEELAFRGYLYRRLQSSEFDQVPLHRWALGPVLISSLLFGILHPDRWLAGTIAGVGYAWLMTRRGSLLEAILAHGLTNACLALYVLMTNSWGLW